MEKHPVLYEYYSKYNGGNRLNRVVSSIPRLLRSSTSKFASDSKEFARDTGKIVKDGLRDNIRDNIATELFQGNNPYDSFMKNINSRIKNSDEYIYNQMYNKPARKHIFHEFKPTTPFINYNDLLQHNDEDYVNYLQPEEDKEQDENENEDEDENEVQYKKPVEYMD